MTKCGGIRLISDVTQLGPDQESEHDVMQLTSSGASPSSCLGGKTAPQMAPKAQAGDFNLARDVNQLSGLIIPNKDCN